MSTDTSSDDTTAIPVMAGADVGAPSTDTLSATVPPPTGSSGDQHDPPLWRRTALWWAPLALLLAALAIWIGFLMLDRAGTAMPGVTLEGVDVSGMNAQAIDAEMSAIVNARRNAVITATAAEQTFTMQMGPEGYGADIDAAVDAALSAGRTGPLETVVNHVEASFGKTWDFPLMTTTTTTPIDDFVAMVSTEVDFDPDNGSVTVDGETAEVASTMPAPGLELDQETARALVLEVAGNGNDANLQLPTTVVEPITTIEMVTASVDQLEAALAEPYVLAHGDGGVTIEPTEFATWLSVADADGQFAVTLDRETLTAAMEGRGDAFNVEPVSARYSIQSGWRTYDNKGSGTFRPSPASVAIIEGHSGLSYNAETAATQVLALYDDGGHTAELNLEVTEPHLSNARAEELRPDALLGTFTTYDACCGNRQHNIRRLADLVDGAMLLPGENYSVNDTIGPRTLEKGFVPAGAIIDGEIDNEDIGGGISQTATTFYNAAFFAGIEILEHRPHSWPISRYPMGREATFDYAGDLDINILNNTSHALIVSTSWSGSSVTFSIFGHDDGREVTAEMGSPYNYRDFSSERRPTSELTVGNERVVQEGGQGFSVDFRRIISGGETPGTENHSWTYSTKTKIIEYGTRDPTEPAPKAASEPPAAPPG